LSAQFNCPQPPQPEPCHLVINNVEFSDVFEFIDSTYFRRFGRDAKLNVNITRMDSGQQTCYAKVTCVFLDPGGTSHTGSDVSGPLNPGDSLILHPSIIPAVKKGYWKVKECTVYACSDASCSDAVPNDTLSDLGLTFKSSVCDASRVPNYCTLYQGYVRNDRGFDKYGIDKYWYVYGASSVEIEVTSYEGNFDISIWGETYSVNEGETKTLTKENAPDSKMTFTNKSYPINYSIKVIGGKVESLAVSMPAVTTTSITTTTQTTSTTTISTWQKVQLGVLEFFKRIFGWK